MQTSPVTIKKTFFSTKGFTLIELMIVLAIMAGIVALGASTMRAPQRDIRSDIRKLFVLSKQLNRESQLHNKIFRLVFTLDKENASYWVESTDKKTITEANMDTFAEKDPEKKTSFQMAENLTKQKIRLPIGFYFKQLYLLEQDLLFEAQNEVGYIHFFPQGMADAAALQIASIDEKLAWTLVINPLTGSAQLLDGLFGPKELNRE